MARSFVLDTCVLLADPNAPLKFDEHDVVLTGFDESLLGRGQPALEQRAPAYATDADAFRAVLADPNLIIVNQGFSSANQGGGPPQAGLAPGDTVRLVDAGTNTDTTAAGCAMPGNASTSRRWAWSGA